MTFQKEYKLMPIASCERIIIHKTLLLLNKQEKQIHVHPRTGKCGSKTEQTTKKYLIWKKMLERFYLVNMQFDLKAATV